MMGIGDMINFKAIEDRKIKGINALRHAAVARAQEASSMLKARYGVKHVILFGSVCGKGYMHGASDIDLLVEGLKEELFFRAGFDAEMITKPFGVDLIPAEKAIPEIIAVAKSEGVEI